MKFLFTCYRSFSKVSYREAKTQLDSTSLRLLLEQIGKKLNVKELNDWYNVKAFEFVQEGGSNLMKMYKWDLSKILQSAYPGHYWEYWKFKDVDSRKVS